MSEPGKDKEKLAEGTLISHLLELRDRMIRMAIALVIVFVPCVYFGNEVLTWLAEPLTASLPKDSSLVSTSVMGVFLTPFKLSFYVSLVIIMPYLLYEIWGFVAPGLYKHEKKFAAPLVFSPTNARTLYYASDVLWTSTTGGQTWAAASPDFAAASGTTGEGARGAISAVSASGR